MINYIGNCSLTQRELFSELSLSYAAVRVSPSYFSNLGFVKFGHCVFTASAASPFVNHVLRVVFGGSGKKMFRVDALFNVAPVADSQPVRNLPKMNFIGKAMRTVVFGMRADLKRAVTGMQNRTSPQPAGFRFLDSGPELFNQRLRTWYCSVSHDMSLLPRFKNWLGSHAVQSSVLSRLILT